MKYPSKELILQEANAYGLRDEVITMAESIKTSLASAGLLDEFTEEQIYQEAYDTCINAPDYFDYYLNNFK
jgi:undecaprenyl pyrophosphate synthase